MRQIKYKPIDCIGQSMTDHLTHIDWVKLEGEYFYLSCHFWRFTLDNYFNCMFMWNNISFFK